MKVRNNKAGKIGLPCTDGSIMYFPSGTHPVDADRFAMVCRNHVGVAAYFDEKVLEEVGETAKPSRPTVAELSKTIATAEDVGWLESLVAEDDRKGVRNAAQARMEELFSGDPEE